MEETVNAMSDSNVQVNQGVEIADNAGTALEEIITTMARNKATLQAVADSYTGVNEGTQQLGASSQQIASAIQQISSASRELSDIAMELQQHMHKFKL